ncbi:hypothetical protein LguiB_003547 [Lonicera macranthoides]
MQNKIKLSVINLALLEINFWLRPWMYIYIRRAGEGGNEEKIDGVYIERERERLCVSFGSFLRQISEQLI